MSNDTFEILRAAVNVARDRQVRRLSTLRALLARMFPGQDAQIDEAIQAWSSYAQRSR